MRPEPLSQQYLEVFTISVVAFFALTIASAILKSRFKKYIYGRLLNSLYSFFLANAIIGLLLLFFTYELIPFLSSHFWLLVWGISMLVWLGFIIKKLLDIPKRKEELSKEKEFKKYIP